MQFECQRFRNPPPGVSKSVQPIESGRDPDGWTLVRTLFPRTITLMTILHAYDFLTSPLPSIPGVTVIAGSDSGLRGWAVSLLNQHDDLTTHDGELARWNDVRDDLSTASLFSFAKLAA